MIKYSKLFNDYCKGFVDGVVKGKRNPFAVRNWDGYCYFTEGHIMIKMPEDICPIVTQLDDGESFAKMMNNTGKEITLTNQIRMIKDKQAYIFNLDSTLIYVDKKLLDSYIDIKNYDINYYAVSDVSPVFLETEQTGVFALILPIKMRM